MTSAKAATLTFRIEAELKETVRIASVSEHRSIANMIAAMTHNYCGRVGVEDQELPTSPMNAARKVTSRKRQ